MQEDLLAGKLPVTLVTGFLGSGKTTMISRLLKHPGMNRVAVIVNEIGEVGIDHDLIATSSESVSLLANGCLCCTVRTDLQETLRELFGQRRAGQIPDFDRVIIETTGMADPAPVVQTLASDTMLSAHYRLDGVVTLLDAVNGAKLLEQEPEAIKQVAMADLVLITKLDLAGSEALPKLTEAVRSLNGQAPVESIVMGEVDPARLVGLGLSSARGGDEALRFLGVDLRSEPETQAESSYLGSRLGTAHQQAIRTLSLYFDVPFTWKAFSTALEMIINIRGEDLLRVKGIVNVEGQPVIVQGVQHVMHPAVKLEKWPSDDRRSRLVFITRNIDPDTIRGLFSAAEKLCPSNDTLA